MSLGGRASCPPSWERGHLALGEGWKPSFPGGWEGGHLALRGLEALVPRGLFLEAGAEMWGHDGAGGGGAAEKAVAAVAYEVVAHVAHSGGEDAH